MLDGLGKFLVPVPSYLEVYTSYLFIYKHWILNLKATRLFGSSWLITSSDSWSPGGGFLFYWNSQIGKIEEVRIFVQKNIKSCENCVLSLTNLNHFFKVKPKIVKSKVLSLIAFDQSNQNKAFWISYTSTHV